MWDSCFATELQILPSQRYDLQLHEANARGMSVTEKRPYATRPRERILHILRHSDRYLSAAEIYDQLQAQGSDVHRTTIYRTLERLIELGLISSREQHGEAKYHFCTPEHHHHAICARCGHVEEVQCISLAQLKKDLLAHHGFAMDGHSIELYGLCRSCSGDGVVAAR